MATIERDEQVRIPHELPVFVTSDDRRARRLRLVASAIAVLALLWLAALAAGMFGFGRLPGISTPLGRIGGPDKAKSDRSEGKTQAPTRFEQRSAELISDAGHSGRGSASQPTARGRASTTAGGKAKPAARRPRTPVPPVAVQPVQPLPVLPPPPQQGWSRHGRPAPPGYTRRTQPQPAPPPPGQASAPGQVKKALLPPPPPPPPPPGNGGGSKKP
jgi:hypothetical protein